MRAFSISFLLTVFLTPMVIAMAHRCNWVAKPRLDRWHSKPTALMGGIGIFVGTLATWLITGNLHTLVPVIVPAVGLFLLGVIDDQVLELRPHHRLIGQLAAGTALIVAGVSFKGLPHWLGAPLTLLWLIGITNAVNLLDNMDGLAAGVTGISSLALAICCWGEGAPGTATGVLAIAGACAGFLVYNFNPARIFMGDCGSMFLGFSLAALVVQGTSVAAPNLMISLLVPVSMLAIPIFDTTLVTVARTLNGRPISQGYRDHTSHRMVALGLSERGTVVTLYGLTALFGLLALLVTRLSAPVVLLLSVLLLTGMLILGLYLGFLKVYPDQSPVPGPGFVLGGKILFKKQLLQVLLDIQLVPLAFVGAYLLRFDGRLPPEIGRAMTDAVPVVVVAKVVALALCRAHRGVWRYAGIVDGFTAVAGSTVGSLLATVLLVATFGWHNLPRTALILDWLLFTILAVVVRLGYVLLRELFGMLPPKSGPRVLILGAGAEAPGLIQRLRDPLLPRRARLCGILDDDPGKHGRTLNGIPVLGAVSRLPELVEALDISYCLLGVLIQSEEGELIVQFCQQKRVPVYSGLDAVPASSAADAARVAA